MLAICLYLIVSFLIYGSFYITFEVFFTAFSNSFNLPEKVGFHKNALWGVSSVWMFVLGGTAGLILSGILLIFPNLIISIIFLPLYIIAGGIIITVLELLAGLVFNKLLKWGIWDYSTLKFNFLGQIELWHSIGWCGLSFAVFWFSNILSFYFIFKG